MKILVAVDENPSARTAFEKVIEIVKPGDEVFLIAVAEDVTKYLVDFVASNPNQLQAMLENIKTTLRGVLQEYGKILSTLNIAHKCMLGCGGISDVVCYEAKKLNVDLIVVGRRGLSAWQRTFVDSQSSSIAHHAPCAVLVVRTKEEIKKSSPARAELLE